MPYSEIGKFMVSLRAQDSVAALALEFTILTVTRTTGVRETTWPEIDFANGLWTIPGERMKGGREHRVPLSERAMEILRHKAGIYGQGGFIFTGRKPNRPLSDMAMLMLLRRITQTNVTVHGFRSSFRDWGAEHMPGWEGGRLSGNWVRPCYRLFQGERPHTFVTLFDSHWCCPASCE